MTETMFAGATVGPKGVQPDLAKLLAIVNWEQPFSKSHSQTSTTPQNWTLP